MNCPNCNAELRDGAKFCQKCGTPITAQEPIFATGQSVRQYDYQSQQHSQYGTQTMTAPAPKKNAKGIIIAVVAVLLVAGIVVGSIFIFKSCNDPSKGTYREAVVDCVKMLNDGKIIKAIEKYSIDGKIPEMYGMESAFSEMFKNVKLEVVIDGANSRKYTRGMDEDFNYYISDVTDNEFYRAKATEVAVIEIMWSVKGVTMGERIDSSGHDTIYAARIDGAWKVDPYKIF